jgi:hypothetical protein
VTEGIERAVALARSAPGGKDVLLMGAQVVEQALRAKLLDQLFIRLVRLFSVAVSACWMRRTLGRSWRSSASWTRRA